MTTINLDGWQILVAGGVNLLVISGWGWGIVHGQRDTLRRFAVIERALGLDKEGNAAFVRPDTMKLYVTEQLKETRHDMRNEVTAKLLTLAEEMHRRYGEGP